MYASNDGLDCIEHFAEFFRETSDKRSEYYALYRDHKIDSMTRDENYAFFGTMKTDEPSYQETLRNIGLLRGFSNRPTLIIKKRSERWPATEHSSRLTPRRRPHTSGI